MKKTRVAVDYGDRQIDIDVPGRVTIARFKEPRRLRNPAAAVKKALAEPYGSPPLADLIKPGMKVAVGFDDPTRPPAPWQVMLPVVVDALVKGGVRKKDILLICAGGAHHKYTPAELAAFVGPEIFNRFWPSGQLTCHDCHDPDQLTDLGVTRGGGVAVHNRRFVEADLMIYCGQVMAHNWGGYTGMGVVVGLAGTRSINSHHSHRVVDDPKSTTGDHVSMLYRRVKAEIQGQIEKATGKRIFYVNWVGGAKGRMAGVFAGYSPEVEPPAWKLADSFHRVKVPQADILVLGLPLKYAYGTVHDPLIATVGLTTPPRTWLGKPVLKEGGVVIGLAPSTGTVNTDNPSILSGDHRPLFPLPQHFRSRRPRRHRRQPARVSAPVYSRSCLPSDPRVLAVLRKRLRAQAGQRRDHGRDHQPGRLSVSRHHPGQGFRSGLEIGEAQRRRQPDDRRRAELLEPAHLQVRRPLGPPCRSLIPSPGCTTR